MAKRAPRSLKVETSIHLRDEDWTLTANYYPGYAPRPWAYGGEGDPGDPGEITDVEISADGHHGVLDYEHLTKLEQAKVDETIALAADDEAISRDSDDDDRRCDADRDDRRLGQGRYER